MASVPYSQYLDVAKMVDRRDKHIRKLKKQLDKMANDFNNSVCACNNLSSENYRLMRVATNAHDAILAGAEDKELIDILEKAWKFNAN